MERLMQINTMKIDFVDKNWTVFQIYCNCQSISEYNEIAIIMTTYEDKSIEFYATISTHISENNGGDNGFSRSHM